MKMLNLALMLLVLSVILTGCVDQGLKAEKIVDGSVSSSPEEGEISSGLEDLEDIESMGEDLEQDFGLEELEELEY